MRDLLDANKDKIVFAYNFHSYGPMYIWPYNSQMNNELARTNPVAQQVFNEIWEDALFPSTTLSGNAIDTVGYISNGEANDFIMK